MKHCIEIITHNYKSVKETGHILEQAAMSWATSVMAPFTSF